MGRQLFVENDSCAAVVVTLESTSISACSSGSLVSKGRFVGLCLRFADDFETSLDDWKPDTSETAVAMNLCVVSEGTYEVCSRTVAAQRLDTGNTQQIHLCIVIILLGLERSQSFGNSPGNCNSHHADGNFCMI